MTDLTLNANPTWHENINQVETTDAILGGPTGNANLATKQLAENMLWLRTQMENVTSEPIKVGDIYQTTISHSDSAAVAAHHGYGTWARFAEGRTLVGFSTKAADPDDYKTMGAEFGANKHKLTVPEMPAHNHPIMDGDGSSGFGGRVDTGVNAAHQEVSTIGSRGGDEPHNNIQPSKVIGAWLRTA